MNLLITNDDGFDADGIAALIKAAQPYGDVWVVAPDGPRSGISHRITFDRPLKIRQVDDRQYANSGTPADCVRWAVSTLPVKFDWVFSGINNGANLGADLFVSGTVAATRESNLQRIPSISFSQHRLNFGQPGFNWDYSSEIARQLIPGLIARAENISESEREQFGLNVNFPDCSVLQEESKSADSLLVDCVPDYSCIPSKFDESPSGQFMPTGVYNDRSRETGKDIDLCFKGKITVTGIGVNWHR